MRLILLTKQQIALQRVQAVTSTELRLLSFSLLSWWLVSLVVLLGNFIVIIVSYIVANYFFSTRQKQYASVNELDQNVLDQNVLTPTTLERNSLDLPMVRIRRRIEVCARVATVSCIIIVFLTVALYLGSLFFGTTPTWYSMAQSGLTFVSVYLVYDLWRKVRE